MPTFLVVFDETFMASVPSAIRPSGDGSRAAIDIVSRAQVTGEVTKVPSLSCPAARPDQRTGVGGAVFVGAMGVRVMAGEGSVTSWRG